jgi:hypothetical protein
MAKRVPSETRRLTRSEASRLGVSYGAKRRVNKSVKHVTHKTVLYTDRQVAEARLRVRTGDKKITREKAAKANTETRSLKKGGKVIEFKKLDKAALFKLLRKYRDKLVMLHFRGGNSGAMYKGKDISTEDTWHSGQERITARELLDPDNFADYMEGSNVDDIKTYGLVVYL